MFMQTQEIAVSAVSPPQPLTWETIGAIIAEIPNGASVQIYGSFQGWYSVGYGGQLGYAAQAYIAE